MTTTTTATTATTTTTPATAPAALAIAIANAEAGALALSSATSWTTKAGRSVTRHSPIGAMSAPKAVQVSTAITATLQQWSNGQFRPFLKDVRANLSDAQALRIAEKTSLSPANKVDSTFFLECALFELTHKTVKGALTDVIPKGEKSRIVATIQAILS